MKRRKRKRKKDYVDKRDYDLAVFLYGNK